MGEPIPPRSNPNPQALTLFSATIAWQIYVIVWSYRRAPVFKTLFGGLAADLPPLTRIFFMSYRWWFLVPIVFIVLFVGSLRRPNASPWHSALLIAASLLVGFILQAVATEAFFAPMFSLIEKIG